MQGKNEDSFSFSFISLFFFIGHPFSGATNGSGGSQASVPGSSLRLCGLLYPLVSRPPRAAAWVCRLMPSRHLFTALFPFPSWRPTHPTASEISPLLFPLDTERQRVSHALTSPRTVLPPVSYVSEKVPPLPSRWTQPVRRFLLDSFLSAGQLPHPTPRIRIQPSIKSYKFSHKLSRFQSFLSYLWHYPCWGHYSFLPRLLH